jgi:nucleoside-diphosphate-sugar epimerase
MIYPMVTVGSPSQNYQQNRVLYYTGNLSEKVYHDIADLTEVTSFPVEGHIHRDVDAAILAAHKQYKVPTAIVSPPMIYGVGNGPVKKRSFQIPVLIESILKRGKAFSVLKGQNIWDCMHLYIPTRKNKC